MNVSEETRWALVAAGSAAVGWTGGAAAAAGIARLLARRGTATVWKRIRGEAPPA